ncbi:hypothetical protein FRACYDRAFT_235096 [Fragilariopsis cylindrus CCMP1102]|uniref:Uncharacterized protein n=1 Tax=Fragilariopsis cylindrus CCMP1102 TaxID=635003 RepID=A0A1E7FTG9_9STRA|nr:hypothetical protein FRACYDRAFT_235096 [Fragilariopsis cylindrus CCMP1102]|eukprot:OEU21470.1 hypothetical protein FRACYDRAFT_235096 [Fragilariopsis cylindrus CCMP1102]
MTSLNNDATRKSWSKYIDVSERCTKNNNQLQESNKKGTTATVVEDADIDIEIVITTTTSTTSSTTMAEDEKNGEQDQFIQVAAVAAAAAAVIKSNKDFHSSSGKKAGENQPLPSENSNDKIEQEQIETLKDNNNDFSGQKCHSNRSKNKIDINNNNNNKQQVKSQIKNIKSKLQSILHHTKILLLRELIPMFCQERSYLQCSSNNKTAAAATATKRTTGSATRRYTMNTPPKFQPIICSKLRPPRQFLKLSLLRKKISSPSSKRSNNNANNEVIRVVTEEEDKRDEEEEYRRSNHITEIIWKRILEKNNKIIMKLSRRQQQQQQDEENNSNRTTTPSSSSTAHNQQHPNQNNKNTEKWYYRDSRRLASAADTTSKSTTQSAYCSMEMISFDKENECFHRKEIAYPYQPPSSSASSSYKKCYDSDNANDRQHRYRCLAKTLEVRVTEANNICKYSLIWQ